MAFWQRACRSRKTSGSQLLRQTHARPQLDHLIEVVNLPLKVMFGIRAVEGDTLMPCFRRNGKHRSVRCG